MAQLDLQTFLQERAAIFDETLDVSLGSPFDLTVIQPLLRRLGTDPFTVDFQTFALTRLAQEFPDMATKEGDAITDLLIKPMSIFLDPIIREITRIRNGLSFRDPDILTVDEAEALGANLFSERNTGQLSRGTARIYFAQPQKATVTPANFVTSKTDLHFFPTEVQSISVNEMLFNTESGLYYFDINVIAEEAGDEYNIGVDELATIANMAAAVRITNKRKFRQGLPAETAAEFVSRSEQELTERSMVTLRGITAKVTKAFPEVTRLGVVGFNDPEMQRDIIKGGGLGPLKAFGFSALAVPDGESKPRTRRLDMSFEAGLDFTALIGPSNVIPSGWSLTLIDAFFGEFPRIRDLTVSRVVSTTQIDVEEQVIHQDTAGNNYTWMLRKKEITLSAIPGGILFPDSPNGTVAIPDDAIHIGGASDVLVRSSDLDTSTLLIDNVTDDSPVLSGTLLSIVDSDGHVDLADFVLQGNYEVDSSTYAAFADSKTKSFSLQILDGAAAGTYRVIDVLQALSASPILTLSPAPALIAGTFRWRLLDDIDIELSEPKETRISGNDMRTVQGVNIVDTLSGIDFDALGVAQGDILRIANGPDAGDFEVKQILAPFYDRLQVDRPLTVTNSQLTFSVFRRNTAGGVQRPLVRITSIDLLDSSGQPVGATIPYAKAVDARSNGFANFAHGVKVDVRDARLGIVSKTLLGVPPGENVSGLTLILEWETGGPQTVTFSGPNPISVSSIVSQINTTVGRRVSFIVEGNRFGITPIGGVTQVTGGTALSLLFDVNQVQSSTDVRSNSLDALGGWEGVSPDIDKDLDVLQVLDGFQIGFFSHPELELAGSTVPLLTEKNFSPEANRHIQLGTRSVGTARVYFLEPTSVEFSSATRLSTTVGGARLRFLPDPTVHAQKIPGKPSGTKPKDGSSPSNGNVFTSLSTDFIAKLILPGDLLEIDYVPLTGTVNLGDPVATLALTTLILSVDGGSDKVITFVNDSVAIPATSVTRAGVADQINKAVGRVICAIATSGGSNFLEFEFDGSVVVRKTGTANVLLGFSTVADQNNDALHKGTYYISAVATNSVTIAAHDEYLPLFPNNPASPASETREQFKILRQGTQRFSSTEMAAQVTTAGLYYVDVELVSEGTGDLWNIGSSLAMGVEDYESDGYWLTTDDDNLTFSTTEPVHLHISRTILEVGVTDDPENATQVSGQNIQVNYERSSLTATVENFVTAETERVVCSSPLARHLIPHFVRFDVTYLGGSKESVVLPDMETHIKELFPDDFLEVSDIEKILSDAGATSITNPIDLVAVVHNVDRTVSLDRSQDRLNTGRLAAFIPDRLNLIRKVT